MGKMVKEEFRKDGNIKILDNHKRYFLRSYNAKMPLPAAIAAKHHDYKFTTPWKRSLKSFKVTFKHLPQEIKIKILSYLNIKDICLSVAPVSREWYLYSHYPSLWRSLRFEGSLIPTQEVCRLLRLAPELKRFEITDRTDVVDLLMEVCRSNRQLEHISVNNTKGVVGCRLSPYAVNFSIAPSHFNWQTMESIFEDIPYLTSEANYCPVIPSIILLRIVRSCRRLVSINLVGMEIRSRCFFKELLYLPKLQSVDVTVADKGGLSAWEIANLVHTHLGEGTRPKPFHCHAIYNWCNGNAVTHLSPQWRIQTDGVNNILGHLAPSIVVLNLDVLRLREESFEVLLKCVSLQALHLDNARCITSPILIRLITSLHNLISLRIHTAYILKATALNTTFQSGMRSKDGAIKRLPLKYLSMIGCPGLDDDAIYSIAFHCPELEYLSLAQCQNISAKGLQWILMFLHNLRSLNLWGCQQLIGTMLLKIPLQLPSLKLLMVGEFESDGFNDKKKEENVNLLKNLMPHLRVHYSYSSPNGWTKLCNIKKHNL